MPFSSPGRSGRSGALRIDPSTESRQPRGVPPAKRLHSLPPPFGMSPAAALMASTAWAADLLRVNDQLGRLEPGLAADMVILERDPLADVNVLTDQSAIRAVIQAGRIVRSTLPKTEE